MQIIHVTYRFKVGNNTLPKRINDAFDTWTVHADPKVYRPCHLTEHDVQATSKAIGDPYPHAFLKELIAIAQRQVNQLPATIFFSNADIRLKADGWPTFLKRASLPYPNCEKSTNTRQPNQHDHGNRPHAYYFPHKWWNENEELIPPCLFPCPFWEPHLDGVLGLWEPLFENMDVATEHEPHPRYFDIDRLSKAGRKYNEAIQVGWTVAKFHAPGGYRKIRSVRRLNPNSYIPRTLD